MWLLCIRTPDNAGLIALPMKNIKAPTPTEIPLNSFGDDVTIIFHAAVAVNDNHIAVIARLVDSSDSAKWNPRTAACYNDIVPTAINYKTKK
jgi:hypothetical protein